MLEAIDWGEAPMAAEGRAIPYFFVELNCFLDLGGKVDPVVKTEFVRV